LKAELISISPIVYEILQKVAVNPASSMRINGMDWHNIDEKIYTPMMIEQDKIDKLLEIIALQKFTDCENSEDWKEKASEELGVDISKTNELLSYINKERAVRFDNEIGTLLVHSIV